MSLQISSFAEWFFAFSTVVWLLPTVSQEASFSTWVALMWWLTFFLLKKNCHTKCMATQPSVNSIALLGECCLRHNLFSTHVANKITTHFSEVSAILILLIRLSVMNWLFCNGVYLVPEDVKMPHKMEPKILLMLLIFWVCLHLSGFSPEWVFTWSSSALQCLFGYCWIFSLFAFWWFYPTMSKQVIS